jgi:RHS repeat-associated protein
MEIRRTNIGEIFYYHPNHLGSTSFVTDQNQTITQGFLYAPLGEITTEYNINFGNNIIPKYSFNAKELDEETGMYYYEARYYNPPIFISRDPLMSEKSWLTPYHYCSNNPIGRVDPSGMMDGDYYDNNGKYLGNDGIDDKKVYQLKAEYRAKFENTDVNWGGTLSEKHYTELQAKSNYLGSVQDAFVTVDPISDKRIQSLHPAIRMQTTNFIKEANANSDGTLIRVAQGFRTYAEQDALYAKGRTSPGCKVTKAKGGYSNHNFGLAFDIVGITKGKIDYNLNWEYLSKLGKSNGFEWGGDWKFKDMPHFENMQGNSLEELRALPKDNNGLPILKP